MPFNPKSLENLTHEGRPRKYDEPKKQRRLSLTDQAWENLKNLSEELGFTSVSEMIEELARGTLTISR